MDMMYKVSFVWVGTTRTGDNLAHYLDLSCAFITCCTPKSQTHTNVSNENLDPLNMLQCGTWSII
jgi:hypothetical protein